MHLHKCIELMDHRIYDHSFEPELKTENIFKCELLSVDYDKKTKNDQEITVHRQL